MVFEFREPPKYSHKGNNPPWRGIDTVLPRFVISPIVFQLEVKKNLFFIVCEKGRHVFSFLFGHKTHLRLESKLLERSCLTMRTFAIQKLNQSAVHFTEPRAN